MSLRNLLIMFLSTMAIGTVAGVAVGLGLQLSDNEFTFLGSSDFGYNVFEMALAGLMFGVFSMMGFFAYLMVNYIAIGILRQRYWWNFLQVLLTIVILVNAAIYRYIYFSDAPVFGDMVFPAAILLASLLVAYWKVNLTKKTAFIPALFFMVCVTIIETMPAIRTDNGASVAFMSIPLFVCNAWLILKLQTFVKPKQKKS